MALRSEGALEGVSNVSRIWVDAYWMKRVKTQFNYLHMISWGRGLAADVGGQSSLGSVQQSYLIPLEILKLPVI